MQRNDYLRDKLISEFAENYLEKLFYFCLKRTGNTFDAEDLTSDISVQIISALNKWMFPSSFSAWVWQIARNRYSVWAKDKHSRNQVVTAGDIRDYEIEDKSSDILDEMIYAEQMALLRRELAFIKSEYRDIVVAYYIDNRHIRDIASSLSLSETAVKQRLYRARQILKEGLDMVREFGKRSYNPEDISFVSNGMIGANGEPWNYVSRLLCKNIMLAAYKSPSTAEELAMEIGVALPYMEEELSSLVDSTLMKKNGNKYETNLFIVSTEAQEKIFAHLRGIVPELTKAIITSMEYDIHWRNTNIQEWHEGYQPFDEMKWALLMAETDAVNSYTLQQFNNGKKCIAAIGSWGHTLRPNGGEWDILGLENLHGDRPSFVGLGGCASSPNEKDLPEIMFRQYRFKYGKIDDRTPPLLSYADGQGIVDVANGKSDEVDESILKRIEAYGYIKRLNGRYVPTFLVMYRDKLPQMSKDALEQFEALRYKARDVATQHYLFCREQIYKEIPDSLKEDEFQIDHACANIFEMRGAVLEEAIKQGYLLDDKDNDNRMLGAYLII